MTDFFLFMLGFVGVAFAGASAVAGIVFACKALDHHGKKNQWWS